MSEVACLNGKHCVDTFLDLAASFPAHMESRCLVHVLVGAHVTARIEDWRLVERVDITVQLHPPRLRLSKLLGRGSAEHVVARPALPLPCSDLPESRRQTPQSRYVPSGASLVG